MASNTSWEKIFTETGMASHDFDKSPFVLSAEDIKRICQGFKKTAEKEVRLLCKQDSRSDRPDVFVRNGLFLLPKHNGEYYVVKGEGYVDVPEIDSEIQEYRRKLNFELKSSRVGDSEMQHVDFAYANSLIRTFMNDPSLVLTIRGRKYTPEFSFRVGSSELTVESVQTEVDAGYEGRNSIVLIEAKNSNTKNTIIRQLYYPFRQWYEATGKEVFTLFFEKRVCGEENIYCIWQYAFADSKDYNSIRLVRSARYKMLP